MKFGLYFSFIILFNTFLHNELFRNQFFSTPKNGLSPDNRMANTFSKTFISHPVIFFFIMDCYIMFIDICPAEKEMFTSFSYRDGV